MLKGKVVRYDEVRGYGFIAPESGGDDVFVHVNDLEFDKGMFAPGAFVQFEVEDSGRGLKASMVRLVQSGRSDLPDVRSSGSTSSRGVDTDDDSLCDVLSTKELCDELTEDLISAVPTLTGAQLVQIRQRVASIARGHGWVDLEG